jgi:N-acylneuraminate cytidylyltransferase
VVHENGAFYLTNKNIFKKHKNRLGGKIGIFLMSEEKAVDIDEPEDWARAEREISKRV